MLRFEDYFVDSYLTLRRKNLFILFLENQEDN